MGGRCHDRIYHVDHADEFDATHSGFFINSSLAPFLRFRRRFVSVCNVLKGIKVHGFSEARISALLSRWHAVVRMGPTGPVTSFETWTHWIPPDLHGFKKLQARRLPNGSGILVQPALIDAHFRKAWMPYFRRDGHPVVTAQAFLEFVGDHLPQETLLDLPILTGVDLYEVAMAKKSTAGGLDGWAWNEIKALSLSWFVGLALVLRQIEAAGKWPQGLLDAYIAMIPKAEGDSTPLGQRPLCVLPVVYRLWASVRLAHLKDWFCSWVPDSVLSAGKGVSSVDA